MYYQLCGLIAYKGDFGDTDTPTGHYTAFCLRNEKWLEYDGIPYSHAKEPACKVKKIGETDYVQVPALIMYRACDFTQS